MALRPLGSNFLFSFLNETSQGRFIERSRGSIILTNLNFEDQPKLARWGRVEAVGSECKDIKVGDLVLIEALQWTIQHKYEGKPYWKSDEGKVLAIGEDESVTYTY
jgi:co-chaperonin GroES (HSP10)